MQIKGNFDLTVIITGVGIPTTLREIDWPKASFAKASFSQFWSTIPSQACQLLEIRTWVHETWGKWRNERNVQWTLQLNPFSLSKRLKKRAFWQSWFYSLLPRGIKWQKSRLAYVKLFYIIHNVVTLFVVHNVIHNSKLWSFAVHNCLKRKKFLKNCPKLHYERHYAQQKAIPIYMSKAGTEQLC